MRIETKININDIQFDENVKNKEKVVKLLNAIFNKYENDTLIDLKHDIDIMNINVSESEIYEQHYHISFSPKSNTLNYDVSFLIDKNTNNYNDIVVGTIIRQIKDI